MFEFFRGSNDFLLQKVHLLRLMPVCVGLILVSCLFTDVQITIRQRVAVLSGSDIGQSFAPIGLQKPTLNLIGCL